jgi:spermidine/putrescine transport system permease protein
MRQGVGRNPEEVRRADAEHLCNNHHRVMTALGRFVLLLVVAFLYLPIAIMVAMAFNDSELYALPFQFSTRWFTALAGNEKLIGAARNSVTLAVTSSVLATSIGTLAALALYRRQFRGRSLLRILLLPPIAIPWLITGTAMLVFFFWTGIGRGYHALVMGHVALAVPYVVLVVGTGLQTLRDDLEEAAMSLGATPIVAFFKITFPLIAPSLVAAALFAFAVSLDQFVVSYFLSTPGVSTLPVEIYSAIRKGFTPEINAISALLLGVSMILVLAFAFFSKLGGVSGRR